MNKCDDCSRKGKIRGLSQESYCGDCMHSAAVFDNYKRKPKEFWLIEYLDDRGIGGIFSNKPDAIESSDIDSKIIQVREVIEDE